MKKTVAEMLALDKRPRFERGAFVRVVEPGLYMGLCGWVLRIQSMPRITKSATTFMYDLHMENGARQVWPDEALEKVATE